MEPQKRIRELEQFISDFARPSQKEVQRDLSVWPMKFEPRMLQLKGRTLPLEELYFKGGKASASDKGRKERVC